MIIWWLCSCSFSMQCCRLHLLPGYTSGWDSICCLPGLKAFPKELIPACPSSDCFIAKAPLFQRQELFLSWISGFLPINFSNVPRFLWRLSPSWNMVAHPKAGVIFSNELEISGCMLIKVKDLYQLMSLNRSLKYFIYYKISR